MKVRCPSSDSLHTHQKHKPPTHPDIYNRSMLLQVKSKQHIHKQYINTNLNTTIAKLSNHRANSYSTEHIIRYEHTLSYKHETHHRHKFKNITQPENMSLYLNAKLASVVPQPVQSTKPQGRAGEAWEPLLPALSSGVAWQKPIALLVTPSVCSHTGAIIKKDYSFSSSSTANTSVIANTSTNTNVARRTPTNISTATNANPDTNTITSKNAHTNTSRNAPTHANTIKSTGADTSRHNT